MNEPHNSEGTLRPTSFLLVATLGLVTLAFSFFGSEIWLRDGRTPLVLPLWGVGLPVLFALFVFSQGWRVRSHKKGKKVIPPLAAARIWILTQAGSRAAAILAGASFGIAGAYAHLASTAFSSEQVRNFSIAGLAWLVLVTVSLLAERWCMVDDDGDAPTGGGATGVGI
ncbi:DUF3180 domain-containing protein [Arcanobacterium ihumii]|uniref:DUF3180 domain-containing protein n=1 Tax=Arcanobacterium ihumii TaxID=2138162 RepID=UPI000F542F9B|nr:DUF3180 domain-containing protein [Arcanobacterium ihumii]